MWWSGAIVWHLIKEYDSITTTNDAHTIAQVKYVYVVLVCTKANSNTDVAYICMHKMSLFSCSIWQLALIISKNNLHPLLMCSYLGNQKQRSEVWLVSCQYMSPNYYLYEMFDISKKCSTFTIFGVSKTNCWKMGMNNFLLDTKCYT